MSDIDQLGRAAYERFYGGLGVPFPKWDDIQPARRVHWMETALAVCEKYHVQLSDSLASVELPAREVPA